MLRLAGMFVALRGLAAALALLAFSVSAVADDVKVGIEISVDGEGFFDPVVNRIAVTKVSPGSLAAAAGIVAGDEIINIQGQEVKGKRASELKRHMSFGAGETRQLRLKHANGEIFEARLTKPAP